MWRSGQHEFNGDTSDGTWGYSQFAVTNAITSKDGGFVREGTDGEVTLTAGVAVRWTRRQGSEVDTRGSATLFGVVAGELGGSDVKDWRTSETGLMLPDWIRRKYELGAETHARSNAPSAALWAFPRDVCMESHYPAGVPDEFVTADLADWASGGGEPYLRLDLMDLPSPMRTPLVDKMVDKDHDWGPSGSGEDRVFFDHICAMRTIRNGAVSPLECSGLWTAPVCRTLLQVAPMGAELHWQTQALIDGILTDVLVRLCRAAAEVYATHALTGEMKRKDEGCDRLVRVEKEHSEPSTLPKGLSRTAAYQETYASIVHPDDPDGGNKVYPPYPEDYLDGKLRPLIREPIEKPSSSAKDDDKTFGHRVIDAANAKSASKDDDGLGSDSDDDTSSSVPSLVESDDSDSDAGESKGESNGESKASPDDKSKSTPTHLGAEHVQAAMWRVFPTDLATHGMTEIKDALEYNCSMWKVLGKKEPEDPNKIVFHPTLVHAAASEIFTHLKDGHGTLRYPEGDAVKVKQVDVAVNTLLPYCTSAAKAYMAAVLDYLSAELVEVVRFFLFPYGQFY